MTPSRIFVSEAAVRAVDKLTRDVIALTDLELKEQPAHPATPEHWNESTERKSQWQTK